MYKIIHDEEQVRRFYRECLPRLKPTEVYFLSMSARNKYLNDDERKKYDLGRTEMYAKSIIRHDSEDEFVKHIRRLECDERGYTTRTGEAIPQKCMVCYANIDPSSTTKALQAFMKLIGEYQTEAIAIATGKNNGDNFISRLNKIDNNLLSCYQQAHAKGLYLDIDIDLISKNNTVDIFTELGIESVMLDYSISDYKIIATKSGFHVLVNYKDIQFDPVKLVTSLENQLEIREVLYKEVAINKSRMIPVPGTWQAEYPVYFVN